MLITVFYWLLLAVMLVGVVGAIVPGLPGSSLILIAILVWGVATGFAGVGVPLAVVIGVLILSTGVDILAAYWGAKRVGASKWSQLGALIGLVLGFLGLLPALPVGGPLLGILLGPIVGAFVGEFLYRYELKLPLRVKKAFQVSLGVVIGSLVGNFIQAILASAAVIVFVLNTWPPVGSI
ncbi:MAG: DUF456 domain-containing protein [Cyanophyceae cyanobacterium]